MNRGMNRGMNRVVGIWSGHDCSFCVLENGIPLIHTELERHKREKEPTGDAYALYKQSYDFKDIIITSAYPEDNLKKYDTYNEILNHQFFMYGHHQSHAANAFYSSNFKEALVITIDGGGIETSDGLPTAFTSWYGYNLDLKNLDIVNSNATNVGGVWTRVTRYLFGYESGWPFGHQAGTVMALAALGNGDKYIDEFRKFFTTDLHNVCFTPLGHKKGLSVKDPKNPEHPFLSKWKKIADENEQEKFNMAAAFQHATEKYVGNLLASVIIRHHHIKNLCLSGGVVLNSVLVGKIKSWFPHIENIYIPPVPYDGGLCIGSAQYHWHHVLRNPRVKWESNFTPYLGKKYTLNEVKESISNSQYKLNVDYNCDDEKAVSLLTQGYIVSVFNESAESGRRALGNRSILADPRLKEMKDKVNHKVKHRQWFRPFAPSILRECVSDWFETECDSPYMGFVLKFKEDKKNLVPAVVHFDGTARLQTVTENDNKWYYNFIKLWHQKTNVPIILNTSFNDREPICETPTHAINCFYGTDIDYLYFPEFKILVSK